MRSERGVRVFWGRGYSQSGQLSLRPDLGQGKGKYRGGMGGFGLGPSGGWVSSGNLAVGDVFWSLFDCWLWEGGAEVMEGGLRFKWRISEGAYT